MPSLREVAVFVCKMPRTAQQHSTQLAKSAALQRRDLIYFLSQCTAAKRIVVTLRSRAKVTLMHYNKSSEVFRVTSVPK